MLTHEFSDDVLFKQAICDYWDRVGVEAMVKKLLWWQVALSRLASLSTSGPTGNHPNTLPATWSILADLDKAAFDDLLTRASEEWSQHEQRTEIMI